MGAIIATELELRFLATRWSSVSPQSDALELRLLATRWSSVSSQRGSLELRLS
jgi:hypothetical protein